MALKVRVINESDGEGNNITVEPQSKTRSTVMGQDQRILKPGESYSFEMGGDGDTQKVAQLNITSSSTQFQPLRPVPEEALSDNPPQNQAELRAAAVLQPEAAHDAQQLAEKQRQEAMKKHQENIQRLRTQQSQQSVQQQRQEQTKQ